MANPFYTDYSEYMQRFFPNRKVQKISVNTGNGCPNRDGTIGTGGCIYCNNASFTPGYCFKSTSISEQIEEGKKFFRKKYPEMQYLAYFQSYTTTHGISPSKLRMEYEEALGVDDVVGLIVGTRPDCLPHEILNVLAEISNHCPVFVELGVESMNDSTLRLINRGHDSDAVRGAVSRCISTGLHVGTHLIAGLPGESLDDTLRSVREVCSLSVESIKLHHLQVLKGTPLQRMMDENKIAIHSFGVDEYLDFCVKVIREVPKEIAIERFLASAPPDMVISPKWGLKNYEFNNLLINKLKKL